MWLSAARLSETGVAFAGRRGGSVETAIAFADMKRAILVRFSAALVTVVSTVAVQGRAVVMGVSYWPASAVAEASLVSKLPCRRVLRAKKFALRAQNGPKIAVCGVLGEFCTGLAQDCPVLGEFCTG